jgi:hypothetical protein
MKKTRQLIFAKEVKVSHWGKKNLFNNMVGN